MTSKILQLLHKCLEMMKQEVQGCSKFRSKAVFLYIKSQLLISQPC